MGVLYIITTLTPRCEMSIRLTKTAISFSNHLKNMFILMEMEMDTVPPPPPSLSSLLSIRFIWPSLFLSITIFSQTNTPMHTIMLSLHLLSVTFFLSLPISLIFFFYLSPLKNVLFLSQSSLSIHNLFHDYFNLYRSLSH